MEDSRKNYLEVKSHLSWDQYFMLQAMLASYKSKDPHTKVGCVFVDKNNHQITMGYNGMVAGIDESEIPWGRDRSVPYEHQKYAYVIHSEANALSHCTQSLEGARGYVTLFPCNECAKLIVSRKISEIIYLSDKYQESPEIKVAKRLFDFSKVKYRKLTLESQVISNLTDYLLSLI